MNLGNIEGLLNLDSYITENLGTSDLDMTASDLEVSPATAVVYSTAEPTIPAASSLTAGMYLCSKRGEKFAIVIFSCNYQQGRTRIIN